METRTATAQDTIEALNDLMAINNDRVAGYEKALSEAPPEDTDLQALFTVMCDESREIRADLAREIKDLGGEFETGTTIRGKLYRAWMDIKNVFMGHDRYTALASCERGEDAAQDAYKNALEQNNIPEEIRSMLASQKRALSASHDKIKALRDTAE